MWTAAHDTQVPSAVEGGVSSCDTANFPAAVQSVGEAPTSLAARRTGVRTLARVNEVEMTGDYAYSDTEFVCGPPRNLGDSEKQRKGRSVSLRSGRRMCGSASPDVSVIEGW